MEARRDGVFFRVVHSVSDIDNQRSDDTSMLYHRSCYKTYTSRRNCGFFKVESAGSDHKPDTSQVPLLNKQTDDTSTDIALCIFCGQQIFKKERKLNKIKTAERLQNVKDAAEGQNDYKMSGLLSNATFIDKAVYHSGCITQALVSFKKYVPPPLPYFKVNICSFPFPTSRQYFCLFVILSLTQLYRYTPEIFLFSTATFKYTYRVPLRRIGQEYSVNVAWSTFKSLKWIQSLPVCAGFFICIRNSLDRPCVTMPS
jgi:hypothetical protein